MMMPEVVMANLAALTIALTDQQKQLYEDSIWYAVKALDRRRLLKPKDIYDDNCGIESDPLYEKALFGYCPTCGSEVSMGMNYCTNCGQGLEWSDIVGGV